MNLNVHCILLTNPRCALHVRAQLRTPPSTLWPLVRVHCEIVDLITARFESRLRPSLCAQLWSFHGPPECQMKNKRKTAWKISPLMQQSTSKSAYDLCYVAFQVEPRQPSTLCFHSRTVKNDGTLPGWSAHVWIKGQKKIGWYVNFSHSPHLLLDPLLDKKFNKEWKMIQHTLWTNSNVLQFKNIMSSFFTLNVSKILHPVTRIMCLVSQEWKNIKYVDILCWRLLQFIENIQVFLTYSMWKKKMLHFQFATCLNCFVTCVYPLEPNELVQVFIFIFLQI